MCVLRNKGNPCLHKGRRPAAAASLALLALLAIPWQAGQTNDAKRRITVKDTIEMTEFADRGYFLGGTPDSPVALFSPDGKQFVLRLKKGDVERNVVKFWLLLFQSGKAFHTRHGIVLVTMSSSSNREAIQRVRWLDNRTIVFLGETAGGSPQVYGLDVPSKRKFQLTHHPTPIVSYDLAQHGAEIVYEAVPAQKPFFDTKAVRRDGVAITSQAIDDLLEDCHTRDDPRTDRQLFVQLRDKAPIRVPSDDFLTEYLPLQLSPDGRFAVLAVYRSAIPARWQAYEDKLLHQYIVEPRKSGTLSNVQQYALLDVQRAKLTPLLDAPKAWLDEGIAWVRGSRSVIVSGTYLSLDSQGLAISAERRAHPFVAEIEVPSGKVHEITGERVRISNWDDVGQRLTLDRGYGAVGRASRTLERVGGRWQETASVPPIDRAPIEVSLEEDKNSPPRIFISSPRTGKKKLLLDLNPQFRDFDIAAVETIEWEATDGHEVQGGLYFPPGYERGKRYPLVIQTHGYDENRFWINGPWNSAFAAQPLAAEGIMVLQVGDSTKPGEDRKYTNTPLEGPHRMAAFEGAIDELDRRGLIDRNRVGIIGFSRTAFHVAFTLTHSRYRFRAASMADGFEGGYLSYLLWPSADYEGLNGGLPVGSGLRSWMESSPGFRIDSVSAPVRLEYYGPNAFLGGWQWYSLLSSLGKPVDFLWLPRGTHLLVKPWERLASQQGNVDWFCARLSDH
jgi:dipeptidyl aminopeptidase/acylaminoacyl peptidase